MYFTPTAPALGRRYVYTPAGRSLERFLGNTLQQSRQLASRIEQDEKSVTLTFDVPGVTREQLSIGVEGNVVRIQTLDGAPRQYRTAYELSQDIDAATSKARLENGVLTLTLAKVVPASKATELAID